MIESPRHELDDAIDRVAAKLVAVTDDTHVLQQVMTRLPERTPSPWFAAMPVQLAAGAALVLLAFWYPRSSREPAPIEPPRVAVIAPVESPIPAPRSPIPDTLRDRTVRALAAVDRPDHERSLAPVDAIGALELNSIAAPALELDGAAALEPLVLTELPLASDASSPHER